MKTINISGCALISTLSDLISAKQPNKTLLIKKITVTANTAILTAVSMFMNNNMLAFIILKLIDGATYFTVSCVQNKLSPQCFYTVFT